MADSLGQKLRQAREERDISISEVAEQTRISALYLQAIEEDDYSTLPGGIFNKGFVKSFAKYVGVDEHEALQDYAKIIATQESADGDPLNYRPEVLTDDSRRGSMLPTIIFAVIILGLMAWGIHALVKYVQSMESSTSGNDSLAASNVKTDSTPDANTNANSNTKESEPLPDTDTIKLKVTTSAEELAIVSTADGKRETMLLNTDVRERIIEAEESVKLNYYKGLADTVSLELNGRKIAAPAVPPGYRDNGLIYEINKDNIKKILQDGKIEIGGPPAAVPNANTGSAPGANTTGRSNSNTANAR
ncbi:MAG: helix-turn-helix domain-containing protein [Pyrinomonadaceae bacterium]|nr:helix-turn-helix domain-containing protein [Pyrinomonadaceae bacterium]